MPDNAPITLPKTLEEFMSPAGKAAIARAEQRLNALQNLQLVVVDAAGVQHRGVIEFSGTNAVLRVSL